jgi:hypothetical protein
LIIYNIIASLTAAGIEAWRIDAAHGKVKNINKWVTYFIALLFMIPCFYEESVLNYIFVRGFVYSPFLNILRHKHPFYYSLTTNSKIDQLLNKFGVRPLVVFIISLILSIITA